MHMYRTVPRNCARNGTDTNTSVQPCRKHQDRLFKKQAET